MISLDNNNNYDNNDYDDDDDYDHDDNRDDHDHDDHDHIHPCVTRSSAAMILNRLIGL